MQFNLETALAAWRRTLTYNRVINGDDLDELERHVRDQVEALSRIGVPKDEAFHRAVREVGSYDDVEREYGKVYWGKVRHGHQLKAEIVWRVSMLKNHLKIAWRSMLRQKGYTFINVAGLALGIACTLLMLLYVRFELGYDRFHEKADRTYRVWMEQTGEGTTSQHAVSPPALAPALRRDFPEVQQTVRLGSGGGGEHLIRPSPDAPYEQITVAYADPNFFDVFDFPLLAGSSETALAEPYSVVLTESAAQRYFGKLDVIGRALEVRLRDNVRDVTVTGIIEDIPAQSHFSFEMLGPIATIQREFPGPTNDDSWRYFWAYTYVVLADGFEAVDLEGRLPALAEHYMGDQMAQRGIRFAYHVQPLTDIHLHSHLESEWQPNGQMAYVLTFSIVALLVLLVAIINFVNLATARSAKRAREVGIRKVVGAARTQLVRRFLAESMLLTGIAFVMAIAIALLALPLFNRLTDAELAPRILLEPGMLMIIVTCFMVVSMLAGSYPALFLSGFRPIDVLKSRIIGRSPREAWVRRGLVVTQFVISIGLISGTCGIYIQLRFMKTADYGFDKELIVALPNYSSMQQALSSETVKEQLLSHPGIERVSAIQRLPGDENRILTNAAVIPEGFTNNIPIMWHFIDPDYVPTLGLELTAGRNFDPDLATDVDDAFLINEAAARRFGWDQPVGKKLLNPVDREAMGAVVGVINDFHVQSLHDAVAPIVFLPVSRPGHVRHYAVRLASGDVQETLRFLETKWKQFAPDRAFTYTFLDDSFDALYRLDERMGRLSSGLAVMAILIACLGLFGMAAFTAEQRTKEMGVRKVLGASVYSIVLLLSKNFAALVLVGFIIAAPLTYVIMNRWLADFAHRISLGPGIFLLAGAVALAVAMGTVSYHALKAALADPVSSLRYE